MRILAFDPSGSFTEGSGTTGYVIFENGHIISVGQLKAEDFDCRQDYWKMHGNLIRNLEPDVVVAEDYRLQAGKEKAQIGSQMETVRLLGYMEMTAYIARIPFVLQPASIKPRFSNEILERKKILSTKTRGGLYILNVQVTNHVVDAVRHGMYYIMRERKRNA